MLPNLMVSALSRGVLMMSFETTCFAKIFPTIYVFPHEANGAMKSSRALTSSCSSPLNENLPYNLVSSSAVFPILLCLLIQFPPQKHASHLLKVETAPSPLGFREKLREKKTVFLVVGGIPACSYYIIKV